MKWFSKSRHLEEATIITLIVKLPDNFSRIKIYSFVLIIARHIIINGCHHILNAILGTCATHCFKPLYLATVVLCFKCPIVINEVEKSLFSTRLCDCGIKCHAKEFLVSRSL